MRLIFVVFRRWRSSRVRDVGRGRIPCATPRHAMTGGRGSEKNFSGVVDPIQNPTFFVSWLIVLEICFRSQRRSLHRLRMYLLSKASMVTRSTAKASVGKNRKRIHLSAGFPPPSMIRHGLVMLLVVLSGCTTSIPLRVRATAGHCEPPLAYRYDPAFAPVEDLASGLTPELLSRYPRRNLLAANAIGILPALQTMATLSPPAGRPSDMATELAVLKQRQRVLTQVMLASSTISSLAAELDCEGERADQMANHLSSLDDRRTQRLNVLSIAVGALSGIGTTIGENRKTQYGFGIGGGLLGAGLGLLTLTQEGHVENFEHPRNLLADVWNETASSTVWPPSVWYMLNDPAFSNQGRTGIAHNTRLRWQADEQLAGPDSDERRRWVALLFGTGGTYSAHQLKARADMLNELQSSVRLLNQELQGLLLALIEDR